MLIDCDGCGARGRACTDCFVTVMLGAPDAGHGSDCVAGDLDARERAAIGVLADSGLVPPLRLVPLRSDPEQPARSRYVS